jgi:D-threo-aldose 1-dehydrogenase
MPTRHWDRRGDGGITFTELGFGTAPLGNLYRAISEAEAEATLARAWDAGIRYFDTAPLYGLGLAETRLNGFLRAHRRDDVVVSSKIGRLLRVVQPDQRTGIGKFFDVPSRQEVYDYSYDGTLRSLEASLERLGLDRIDIVYVHDVDVFSQGSVAARDERLAEFMAGGHRALAEMRDQGVIRAFGAGVNEWEACAWLMDRADPDLFLLAGRYSLLEQGALPFLDAAVAKGVGVVIGGPYNSGILATGARPGAFYNYDIAPPEILARVARIEDVVARHGVRLIDAAFQFPLRHRAVVSLIPGGQSAAEIEGSLRAAGAQIPDALWQELRAEGLIRADAP